MMDTDAPESVILVGLYLQQDAKLWKRTAEKLTRRGCLNTRQCDCGYGPHTEVTQVGRWVLDEIVQTRDLETKLVGRMTMVECWALMLVHMNETNPAKFLKTVEQFVAEGLCRMTDAGNGAMRIKVTDDGVLRIRGQLEEIRSGV